MFSVPGYSSSTRERCHAIRDLGKRLDEVAEERDVRRAGRRGPGALQRAAVSTGRAHGAHPAPEHARANKDCKGLQNHRARDHWPRDTASYCSFVHARALHPVRAKWKDPWLKLIAKTCEYHEE